MIHSINIKFTSADFGTLKELKEKKRRELNLSRLSWDKFFLSIATNEP